MRTIKMAGAMIFLLAAHCPAEIPRTKGKISKVTVYRGQALVSRAIDVGLTPGTFELVVEGLPAKIIPESLFAQTSGNARVLSVRYRERAVEADTRREVKELDAQIKELATRIYQTERKKQHLDSQWSMFTRLREFTVSAAGSDLNRGLLTFKPIGELADFIQQKGQEYIGQTLALEEQIGRLKEDLELLNRKREKLDAGRSRTEREAVLYLGSEGGAGSVIELNYLVDGANWLPQYNLRARPNEGAVLIEYNAVVNQTSGEDWNGIALELSTAEPAMVAAAPVLEPVMVGLSSRRAKARGPQQVVSQDAAVATGLQAETQMYRDRSRQFEELLRSRREQAKRGAMAQKQLGRIAASNQAFELAADVRELAEMKQQMEDIARVEGVSVTYSLPGKLTLPSRTDQLLASIASVAVKANFTLVATPLLTDYVYLQAEVLNESDTIFLPGPASMFRNCEFVGRSDQSIVTIGETFTAGFGIDSQIQVTRELEDKHTKIQGGNCIDTYNYRIALSNYKNCPAELRLLDRLPYTDNESIKIELLDAAPALSEAPEYLRTGRKKGILRWDMDLAANSVDTDVTVVNYSFTMEYDKNMEIQPRGNN
jgi:hypothetical protein